jgi:hypothetical protein
VTDVRRENEKGVGMIFIKVQKEQALRSPLEKQQQISEAVS